MAKQTALLDSGATENFISFRTWIMSMAQKTREAKLHIIAGSEFSTMENRSFKGFS